MDNILTNSLLPEISRKILGSMAEGEKMTAIHVSVGEDGEFTYSDDIQLSDGVAKWLYRTGNQMGARVEMIDATLVIEPSLIRIFESR